MAKELREALGPTPNKNVYDKDVPDEIKMELWRQFRAVLEVLRGAGKLGAVHMQFAPWVAFHPDTFDYLEYCRAMLAGFTVAVEFRNKTWFDTERHTTRTLAFERDNGFVNVVVDEPQGIANTIPSMWEVTHPMLSVVRLHGLRLGEPGVEQGMWVVGHGRLLPVPSPRANPLAPLWNMAHLISVAAGK